MICASPSEHPGTRSAAFKVLDEVGVFLCRIKVATRERDRESSGASACKILFIRNLSKLPIGDAQWANPFLLFMKTVVSAQPQPYLASFLLERLLDLSLFLPTSQYTRVYHAGNRRKILGISRKRSVNWEISLYLFSKKDQAISDLRSHPQNSQLCIPKLPNFKSLILPQPSYPQASWKLILNFEAIMLSRETGKEETPGRDNYLKIHG